MKKFVSLLLVCLLMLGCTCTVWATELDRIVETEMETEAEKVARVRAEVLSGNITNDQDVIEVALAEYAAQVEYCRQNGIDFEQPEMLTISQPMNSSVSVAGETVQELAITGLLIVNEDGDQVSSGAVVTTSGSYSGSMEGYTISATITMYVQHRYNDDYQRDVRVSRIATDIEGATSANTRLIQYYEYGTFNEVVERNSGVVTYPSDGSTYSFYPGDIWRVADDPYYRAWAIITHGTTELQVGVQYKTLQDQFYSYYHYDP